MSPYFLLFSLFLEITTSDQPRSLLIVYNFGCHLGFALLHKNIFFRCKGGIVTHHFQLFPALKPMVQSFFSTSLFVLMILAPFKLLNNNLSSFPNITPNVVWMFQPCCDNVHFASSCKLQLCYIQLG